MAEGLQEPAVDAAAVGEADFQLARVDVDVDHFGGHLQPQETDRLSADHQQPAVCLAQGVLQRSVADVSTVEEQVLHPVVAAADRRVTDVPGDADLAVVAVDRDQRAGDLVAEEGFDPFGPAGGRGQVVDRFVAAAEDEMDVGVAEREPGECLDQVSPFGRLGLEEPSADGGVEEQLPNIDDGPDRASAGAGGLDHAAADADLVAALGPFDAAADRQLGDAGDRRDRFTAETECADVEQRFVVGELAGRVAGHGERELIGGDPATVVTDADRIGPAPRDRHLDPMGPGVDAVFEQLFDDRTGAFDHLSRRDLVDQVRRELSDRRPCGGGGHRV